MKIVFYKIYVNGMEYKRLELYVWRTCNHNCIYCCEYPNMEEKWGKKVSEEEILKQLLKFKLKWYNHVTFLWWEPFIQSVFGYALKIAKRLWYTTLVTTNSTTLHLETQAKKYLPYIDQLILSVEGIDNETQKKISRTPVIVKRDLVFKNIYKYWNGNFLKANIVVVKDNLHKLDSIVNYLHDKSINNISFTYPDIIPDYFSMDQIRDLFAVSYQEFVSIVDKIIYSPKYRDINFKITDIPFCCFPLSKLEKYIPLTDDYDFAWRLKIEIDWNLLDRSVKNEWDLPRDRFWVDKCNECKYKWICWWPSIYYDQLYWLDEINPIK